MTAKSETVGVVYVGCLYCGGDGVDPEPHVSLRCCGNSRGDECCGDPDQDFEQQPCQQCGGAGKLVSTQTVDALISGLEALAGEWESSGAAAGYPGDSEFIGAQKERLLDCAAELRALIPAAANTESEEGP